VFQSSAQNAGNTECIGLVETAHAACVSGTAANFTYNFAVLQATTISNLYAQFGAAPGGTNTYTANVRDNGATVMSCTVTGTATACSNSTATAVAAGHFLQVQFVRSGGSNQPVKVALTLG
jgi:hypothetical protein